MADPSLPQKPYGIIYCFTNKVNGKEYVGQTTVPLKKRIQGHINNKRIQGPFQCALKKYGLIGFDVVILAEANDQLTLDNLEKDFIKVRKTIIPAGYNATYGGNGGKLSEQTKLLFSQQRKGKPTPWMADRMRSIRGEEHPSWGLPRPDLSDRNRREPPSKGKRFPYGTRKLTGKGTAHHNFGRKHPELKGQREPKLIRHASDILQRKTQGESISAIARSYGVRWDTVNAVVVWVTARL